MPTLTPKTTNALPVTVTATSAVGGVQLRYTLDGTAPTTNSALYSSSLQFSNNTTLRLSAFLTGWIPSDAAVGYYEPAVSATGLTVTRTITNSPGYAPQIKLVATPIGNVSSYTVTESVPYGITPFNLSPAGAWSVVDRTLKWGPFTNETRTLVYQVSGLSGTNTLDGSGSVDGFPVAITGSNIVVVDLGLMPNPASPAITVQPLSQPIAVGSDLTLYVEAVGAPSPSYQWRKDGTNLAGANSQLFAKSNFQSADAGAYDVVVSNSVGVVTSQVAVVTMMVAPTITSQPQSLTVQIGSMAVFSVVADGVPSPTYQWRFNGTNLANATGSSYAVFGARPADAGTYSVVIANIVGSITSSNAVLTVFTNSASSLTVLAYSTNGFQMSITGATGGLYAVQSSTNLTVWSCLQTNTSPFTFTDTNSRNYPVRYYRAGYLP